METFTKRGQVPSIPFERAGNKEPDHRHRWLLRARRKRPCCGAAKKRNEIAPPQVEHATTSQWADNGTLSLQQAGRPVLGADLNCSESRRWPAPQSASSQSRIAHGERLDGHVEEGCRTKPPLDVFYVRPARSIFSNALNFCCSAIAALVRSPCRYCPFRLPGGLPSPCNRQRPFFVAMPRAK